MVSRTVNGISWTLTYNQENRLYTIANADLSVVATFVYDADGQQGSADQKLLDYSEEHLPGCFSDIFRREAKEDRQRRFWQPTQHPVGIFSEGVWKQKMDYVHQKPCRKGLVVRPEDWRFSSALHWATSDENDVRLFEVGW